MVAFLSQEWLDRQRELGAKLPERPGASLLLQIVVTGAPEGDVAYVQRFEDGRITEASLGADAAAEVVLTQKHPDALAIARGELALAAGVMQGRVKMTGTTGALMKLLPVLQSDEYRTALADA